MVSNYYPKLTMSKEMINISLANPRGFCAGVERAILVVEKTLEKYHLRQELEGLFGVNSIQINMMHLRRIAQEGMASLETIVWVNITSFLVLFLITVKVKSIKMKK